MNRAIKSGFCKRRMRVGEFRDGVGVSFSVARGVVPGLLLGLALMGVGSGCASLRRSAEPQAGPLRYAGYQPVIGDPGVRDPSQAPTAEVPGIPDRPLRSGDPVLIIIRGPEQTEVQDVIDENGMVNLPNIGRLRLVGKTPSQAEAIVERAYIDGGIYLRLTVNILPQVQPRRDSFFVYGEARGPGRYDFTEGMTLMQAIATAGGLTDDASAGRVYIRREGRTTRHSIRRLLRGRDDVEDVILKPGDIITIKARWL